MNSTNRRAVTRRFAAGALMVSVVLAAAACASGSSGGSSVDLGVVDIPDVAVELVGTGSTVPLRSVLPADEPTLVWFWAPH
jgi:hypothetical protein